ncbi:glutathione S-transferase family protein [Parahaliea maris]|uniref:Glutathione S-transferase family protein n=1 Tax=Parahaliea maris TaxID=2716870 RepID=A0A5C8ZYD6_9GAMM|nr:glutathione S-transferase family protein [Parahaliea maris]TXS92809.1 glutathione S-transferase family protein [Parahaliea maris]
MITLYGFPFSNYHNMVKHALMVKGLDFDEQITYPGSPELAAVNPMGKVPAMKTAQGTTLSESSVLLEYLEDAYPQPALLPRNAEDRARVRRITKLSELYLELSARRLLPAVLANADIPPATLTEVRETMERGVNGLKVLAAFSPYVAGPELSVADIFLRYALAIPKLVGPTHLNLDVLAAVPGLAEWDAMMADTDIARKIDADQQANAPEFMAYVAKRLA